MPEPFSSMQLESAAAESAGDGAGGWHLVSKFAPLLTSQLLAPLQSFTVVLLAIPQIHVLGFWVPPSVCSQTSFW
jgi:hypothetical protein